MRSTFFTGATARTAVTAVTAITAVVAALAALAAPGCARQTAFKCDALEDCAGGGPEPRCEPNGFCSFADPNCPSMRSYGGLSGELSGQCLEGDPTPDAMPDGAPADVDGDGVPDATDNCPEVANADQGNEDGDALGDACDPCPPDADNTDADGDGVGDACDPNPAVPGDAIAVFEGFHAGVPASWDQRGTWSPIDDDVIVDVNGPTTAWITAPVTGTHNTVTTSVTVVETASLGSIGLADNHRPTTTSSVTCSLFDTPSGPNQIALREDGDPESGSAMPFEMMVNETYRLSMTRNGTNGTNYTCRGQRANNSRTLADSFSLTNEPHHAGVFVSNASARVRWVMIVTSP